MLTQTPTDLTSATALSPTESSPKRSRYAGGAVLIILGVSLLIGPLTGWRFSWMALPTMAAVFLTWGLIIRSFGLLIPGGILAGIALGVTLTQNMADYAGSPANGALFLLCFVAGWALISLLSPFTTTGFRWWPLIPGAVLALVGGALATNQPLLLNWLSYLGPLTLIGIGAWLVLRKRD